MFDSFISPSAGWRPPSIQVVVKPLPARTPSKPPARHWTDDAADELWEAAILGYLRARRREAVPYWQVVNSVVSESIPSTRWGVRLATKQVLLAVKALLQDRRILRYRRRYLTVLDLGQEIVPLDVYHKLGYRTATGRRTVDSTHIAGAVKTPKNLA